MKYLKKSAEVLIGKAGVQKSHLSDYTATLVLPTHYSDGSGEDLLGIQVTREHLEHLRNEIDRYLSETTEDKPKPKSVEVVNNFSIKSIKLEMGEEEVARIIASLNQPSKLRHLQNSCKEGIPVAIDLKLVLTTQYKPSGNQEAWSAKLFILTDGLKDFTIDGKIELSALGDSQENAKKRLNIGFHNLIMACLYPDSSDLRILDIVRENQQPSSENGEQTNKPDDKDSAPFKLNPSRVMSMKIGADKWEARTKLFNWTSDGLTDLVATADSEEAAREELDKKFSSLAGPMMNFIKFMSQAS